MVRGGLRVRRDGAGQRQPLGDRVSAGPPRGGAGYLSQWNTPSRHFASTTELVVRLRCTAPRDLPMIFLGLLLMLPVHGGGYAAVRAAPL